MSFITKVAALTWIPLLVLLSDQCNSFSLPIARTVTRPLTLTTSQTAPTYPVVASPLFADQSESGVADENSDDGEKKGAFKRFMDRAKPKSGEEKLTTKERLAKMGLATLLSYGWVSNINSCITVGLSWFAFAKKTKLSPLAEGQWKPFLAVYAGFYVASNFLRPFRIAISIGIGPLFDRIIANIQEKLKVSKPAAIGVTVFVFNIVMIFAFMGFCITAASLLAGVPIK